jgi:hypothetical protein
MYKVIYYMTGSTRLSIRWFDTFAEATEFSIKLPPYSVLEVKKYDNKASDTKNNSNADGGC